MVGSNYLWLFLGLRPIFQGFCTHSFVTPQPQGSNVRSSACSLLRWPICAWSIGAADHLRAMKKTWGCCLGYIGDDKLPSYVAIFWESLYETTRGFLFFRGSNEMRQQDQLSFIESIPKFTEVFKNQWCDHVGCDRLPVSFILSITPVKAVTLNMITTTCTDMPHLPLLPNGRDIDEFCGKYLGWVRGVRGGFGGCFLEGGHIPQTLYICRKSDVTAFLFSLFLGST